MNLKRMIIKLLVFGFLLVSCAEQNQFPSSYPSSLTAAGVQISNLSGNWAEPIEIAQQVLQTSQAEIGNIDLAITQQGDRFIAWETDQYAPTWNVNIQIQHQTATKTEWQNDFPFASSTLAATPQIFTHPNTDVAYFMWQVLNPNLMTPANDTFISRFVPAKGWSTPIKVGQFKHSDATPQLPDVMQDHELVMSATGDAVILQMIKANDGTHELLARHFNPDTGLSSQANLIVGEPSVIPPRVMAFKGITDNNGTTHVYWLTEDPLRLSVTPLQLWYNRYTPDTGWETTTAIEQAQFDTADVTAYHLFTVADPASADHALMISIETGDSTTTYMLQSMQGQWQALEQVANANTTVEYSVTLAANGTGQAVIVWPQIDFATATLTLQARRFNFATGWETRQVITVRPWRGIAQQTYPAASNNTLNVALNNNGAMGVLWNELDATLADKSIYYAVLFDPLDGWGEPVALSNNTDNTSITTARKFKIDNHNVASVVWVNRSLNNQQITYHIMLQEHDPAATNNSPALNPAKQSSTDNTSISPPVNDIHQIPAAPNTPAWPTVSDAWSNPFIVWQPSNASPWQPYRLGTPQLISDINGSIYLSIYADLDYDQSSPKPQFFNHENALLHYDPDGTWSTYLPPLSLEQNVIGAIQIETDVITGGIFGASAEGGELYVSAKARSPNWLTPYLLTNDVKDFYLISENSSHAFLLWRSTAEPLTLNINHLRILACGALEISASESVTAPAGFLSDKPAVNKHGELAVLWAMENNDSGVLKIFSYEIFNGWNASYPPTDFSDMDPSLGLLATTFDGYWAVIARTLTGKLFGNRFSPTGVWRNWTSIDGNVGKIDIVLGRPKLMNNQHHSAMLLWLEESRDTTGVVYRIYSSQYIDAEDSQGKFWKKPLLVGETPYLPYHEMPNLYYGENEQALALWANYNDDLSIVYANKYTPQTGWLPQPETIVVTNNPAGKPLTDPVGTILPDGKIIVAIKNTIDDSGAGFTLVESRF